jgi:hypothetical protein
MKTKTALKIAKEFIKTNCVSDEKLFVETVGLSEKGLWQICYSFSRKVEDANAIQVMANMTESTIYRIVEIDDKSREVVGLIATLREKLK